MDGDRNELGTVHEGSVDIRHQTSNNLDLNVEQNCYSSPNVTHANDIQPSSPSSAHVFSADTVFGIGTEFESDDHAYRFYNKYARLVGFNVRKDWINRSKVHGQVVSRKFTCSKEGYRRKDKRDVNVKKHRKETRTGCLAHMIVTRRPDGNEILAKEKQGVCLVTSRGSTLKIQHFFIPYSLMLMTSLQNK